MVAVLEILFLIVCVVLGLWWFSRTSRWSHLKSERGRGPDDLGRDKHELSRSQRELSRKHFRDDDAGPQIGGGQNYSGGAGF
jgi:hypothetical protein